MENSVQVTVRPFKESDVRSVACIIASSFSDKFGHLLPVGLDACEVLLTGGLIDPRPFPGNFVAEINGQVAGTLMLKWKGQDRPKMEINLANMVRKYGLYRSLKVLTGLYLLDESPDKGECYIEHIAVSPEFQGSGVGSRLLEIGKLFA